MNDPAALEINLAGAEKGRYSVELRFAQPGDKGEPNRARGGATFPLNDLRALWAQPEAYGQRLTGCLLAEPALRSFFDQALAIAQSNGWVLRLRTWIDRSAADLDSLCWETLQNPQDGCFLATDQNYPLSRYLQGEDWSPVRLRARRQARALVVVANPADLAAGKWKPGSHTLAPLQVADELLRARQGLQGHGDQGISDPDQLFSDPGDPGRVTLDNLLAHLDSDSGYAVLYLACHGALLPSDPRNDDSQREPVLYLEKPDGDAAAVRGEALVERLRTMGASRRPALVVLASCQSAGPGPARTTDREGALAALGPRLAQVGIPAVLAMQGDVLMDTVAEFMPTFFTHLVDHGRVDVAMAAARERVRGRPDWWVPLLLTRLADGQIWLAAPARPAQPPSQVPVPPAAPPLYGRDSALHSLARAITAQGDGDPAVTALRGPAGVGKTALALALANCLDVEDAFSDGRAWLPLGRQPDVFDALGRLLSQFGVDASQLDDVDKRADHLRSVTDGKRWLLILDDVWDAGDTRPFLTACRGEARAVITTWNAQIADDLKAAMYEVKVLDGDDAIEMLKGAGDHAELAVAADPAKASDLVEIVGCLPLALHVIGRRLNRLARADGVKGAAALLHKELADQPTEVLTLPAAERRPELDEAEPSLKAVLDLSYRSLDKPVQRAFRRLAVFGGQPMSFDAAAMATVWEGNDKAASELRMTLVENGLLERLETPAADTPRYQLHPVMAIFAESRLKGPEEAREAHLAHGAHYAAMVGSSDGRLEWAQLTRALDYLSEQSAADDRAVQILLDCARRWDTTLRHNYDPRRSRWVGAAVTAAHAALAAARLSKTDEELAEAVHLLAETVQLQGEIQQFENKYEPALESFQEAKVLHRQDSDRVRGREGEVHSLKSMGHLQRLRDRPQKALQSYQEALGLLVELRQEGKPAPSSEVFVLWSLSKLQNMQENHQEAHKSLLEAEKLWDECERTGEDERKVEIFQGQVSRALGDTLFFLGEWDAVPRHYEKALELFGEEEPVEKAQTLASQGAWSLVQGDEARAQDLLSQAHKLFQENYARQAEAESVGKFGWFLRQADQHARARDYFLRAADLWEVNRVTPQADRYRRAASAMVHGTTESSAV